MIIVLNENKIVIRNFSVFKEIKLVEVIIDQFDKCDNGDVNNLEINIEIMKFLDVILMILCYNLRQKINCLKYLDDYVFK